MADLVVRVRHERRGGHVWVRVFVGPDAGHLALAGSLVLAENEAETFLERLEWADFDVREETVSTRGEGECGSY